MNKRKGDMNMIPGTNGNFSLLWPYLPALDTYARLMAEVHLGNPRIFIDLQKT